MNGQADERTQAHDDRRYVAMLHCLPKTAAAAAVPMTQSNNNKITLLLLLNIYLTIFLLLLLLVSLLLAKDKLGLPLRSRLLE